MRIISPGVDPLDTPQQVPCQNCTAVIEFKPSEVQTHYDARDGNFYAFNCLCCGKLITKAIGGYRGPG